MLDYLIKRPMIIAAVGCIIMAVCGFYSDNLLMIFICLSAGFLIISLALRKFKRVVVGGLVMIMGLVCLSTLNEIENLRNFAGKEVTANIIFTETEYKSSAYYRSRCEVIGNSVLPKGTKLTLWHDPLDVDSSYVFKAKISLEEIDADYKATNYSEGVYLSGNIITLERTESYDGILRAVNSVRRYIKRTLFGGMSFDSASTMCAVVFGDKSYFTDAFYNNVKASGVAHVMVVSGMHLGVLVMLALYITEKFIYNPKLRALIMYLVVIMLTFVCGFTMSILRAGITYIIMGIGLLLNRDYTPENALGSAVVLILLSSPFAIFSVSFLLSVLSTLGILAVALPVCKYIDSKVVGIPKFIRYVLNLAVISLSALGLTLPVVIKVFGYVSTVAVVTNLLISFAVTLALSITVVALIVSLLFPNMGKLILSLSDLIVKYINLVINFMGGLPFATAEVPTYFWIFAVLLIFCVFWLLLACKKRNNMIKLSQINQKVIKERGSVKKWQSFLRKH